MVSTSQKNLPSHAIPSPCCHSSSEDFVSLGLVQLWTQIRKGLRLSHRPPKVIWKHCPRRLISIGKGIRLRQRNDPIRGRSSAFPNHKPSRLMILFTGWINLCSAPICQLYKGLIWSYDGFHYWKHSSTGAGQASKQEVGCLRTHRNTDNSSKRLQNQHLEA